MPRAWSRAAGVVMVVERASDLRSYTRLMAGGGNTGLRLAACALALIAGAALQLQQALQACLLLAALSRWRSAQL